MTGIDWRLDRKRARKLGAVLGVGLAHVALLVVLTRSQPPPSSSSVVATSLRTTCSSAPSSPRNWTRL